MGVENESVKMELYEIKNINWGVVLVDLSCLSQQAHYCTLGVIPFSVNIFQPLTLI